MSRFIVADADEVLEKEYDDPEFLTEGYGHGDSPSFLVDTKTNEVIWSDGMEPEDASLGRSLRPLVALLNKVADECGGSR
jgi:hypothetical protein